MTQQISFVATLPATESAIKVHGQSGMRITLDVPESEVRKGHVLRILTMREKQMTVTVEER